MFDFLKPKPENYCWRCGEGLVESVRAYRFDTHTGLLTKVEVKTQCPKIQSADWQTAGQLFSLGHYFKTKTRKPTDEEISITLRKQLKARFQ